MNYRISYVTKSLVAVFDYKDCAKRIELKCEYKQGLPVIEHR